MIEKCDLFRPQLCHECKFSFLRDDSRPVMQIKSASPLSRRVARLFLVLIGLLLLLAAIRLRIVFPHLVGESALDLTSRAIAVHQWFSGHGLYGVHSSTYPPASHVILWPVLGWLPLERVGWMWAFLSIVSLGWLVRWCFCHANLPFATQRWLLAAWLLAMTATSMALWLGQSIPLLLALLTLAVLLIHNYGAKAGWKREIAAVFLMTVALVKPSVSLPFLWLFLWPPARPRVGIGVVLAYAALTVAALRFQNNGLQEMMGWAETVNRNNAGLSEGYANLRVWLAAVGLKSWSHPAALATFLWLGAWTYRYRGSDLWLRLGVTGVVARLWTYHNSYDDMLLLLPLLALLQIAGRNYSSIETSDDFAAPVRAAPVRADFRSEAMQAQWLLTVLALLLLLHAEWLFSPTLWGQAARTLSGLTMVFVLAFLLRHAKRHNAAGDRWSLNFLVSRTQ